MGDRDQGQKEDSKHVSNLNTSSKKEVNKNIAQATFHQCLQAF